MGSYTCTPLVLIWPQSASQGVICAQAVYKSPYTPPRICITILYYCKIFSSMKIMCFTFFKWNLVLFTSYSKWGSPSINQNAKKVPALTGSTFGIYSRFISGMETKQEPADSLNFFMTHCSLQLCLCLCCNQTQRFIYRSGQALYRECSYIEVKVVYVIIIHGKIVQDKTNIKVL